MASRNDISWALPLQCIATLTMAANFGASGAAGVITMPVMLTPSVSAKARAEQLSKFLSLSEHILPASNGFCSLANLILVITFYLNRKTSSTALEKLPLVGAALASGIGVTVYTFNFMVPINSQLKRFGERLQQGEKEEAVKEEMDVLQQRWRRRNIGRICLLATSAICGLQAILKDSVAL